jgi:phosphatidylethanolamine/phosphatidyl-N-methylethanolamine N-methyltransferase
MIRDNLEVLREYVSKFQQSGTVCSTSPWAAEKMVQPLVGKRTPKSILEVGAGTGPVTLKILDQMQAGDRLIICEINSKLMDLLKERLPEHPRFEELKNQIEYFEGPVQDVPETYHFDVIISALPFLNFELALVQEIFEKYRRLSSPDTVITYYEYMGLRSLSKRVSPKERKERFLALDVYLNELFQRTRIGQERVWANVLPINVYTLKLRTAA